MSLSKPAILTHCANSVFLHETNELALCQVSRGCGHMVSHLQLHGIVPLVTDYWRARGQKKFTSYLRHIPALATGQVNFTLEASHGLPCGNGSETRTDHFAAGPEKGLVTDGELNICLSVLALGI